MHLIFRHSRLTEDVEGVKIKLDDRVKYFNPLNYMTPKIKYVVFKNYSVAILR